MRCFILLLSVMFLAGSPSVATSADYVQWVLESPSDSPFAEVRYEITRRGVASAAIHRRRLPGRASSFQNMALLTPETMSRVRELLVATDAMVLPDDRGRTAGGPESLAAMSWRFEASQAGERHSFVVRDPINRADRRYWRLFSGLRDVVLGKCGALPFQDIYFDEATMGWLHIRSDPPAALTLDGRATELVTPIRDLALKAGKHELLLKSVDGKLIRRYTVRVTPGGNTKLRLSLH